MLTFYMKKILVAEDDHSLSASMNTWLTMEGYQVVTVHNGKEALCAFAQQKYDLLITDIIMPHLSGVELINQIRRIDHKLPIVVISGKVNDQLISLLEKMNVKHVLQKPIKPVEFRKIMYHVFPN